MTPSRWRQIEAIYHAARERAPDERPAYLDHACAGDGELRREIESLLASDTSSTGEFDRPAWDNARVTLTNVTATLVQPGMQIGPYRIEGQLGKGGMGEVFRGTDTRLGRQVAIKTSSENFGDRFEREARAISALNHPHICTLYDIGVTPSGTSYLVMELVEGESLAARLKRGKLPLPEALKYGQQIADALSVAHASGIVHRDLKPQNIMLGKNGVKVLDFGLAKSQQDETITASRAVMGTPAYMAPEQREGKACDARSDIFSLGLVLYEMAVGKRPEPGQMRPVEHLPPQLAQIIERCLENSPDQRWQSASDLRATLAMFGAVPAKTNTRAETPARSWQVPGWLASGLSALLCIGIAAAYWFRPTPVEKPSKFSMVPPEGTSFLHVSQAGAAAVSPDGQKIVFVAEGPNGRLLWVRSLDGLSTRPLAGTEFASSPFWSADGRWIGFFGQNNLKKVDPEGSQTQVLSSVGASLTVGGTWNADNKILYYPSTQAQNVLGIVAASGGQPSTATARNIELLEENHYYPSFLPDGQHYLVEVRGGPDLERGVWLGTLGSNDRRPLLKGTSNAQYAPPRAGSPGYLVFARNDSLMAQPFDAGKGTLSGEAVTVAEHIAVNQPGNLADFSVSPAGVLAFRTAEPAAHELVWYDRTGKEVGAIGDRPGNPRNNLRISPDGKSIAFTRQAGETTDVWIHDIGRGVSSRLTMTGGRSPIWSPDGSQIAFVRGDAIYRAPATNGGAETLVWRGPHLIAVNDWSGDGKHLLLTRWDDKGVRQTWLLSEPLSGEGTKEPVLVTDGIHAMFAPATGAPRWISYDSGGQTNVRAMPQTTQGIWQVSADNGNGTRFRRDGRELYFQSNGSLVAVEVDSGPAFRASAPHVLFPIRRAIAAAQGQYAQGYDVTADGSRFLATFPAPDTPAPTITVLMNWQAMLKK